jgi:hypothetical protein
MEMIFKQKLALNKDNAGNRHTHFTFYTDEALIISRYFTKPRHGMPSTMGNVTIYSAHICHRNSTQAGTVDMGTETKIL